MAMDVTELPWSLWTCKSEWVVRFNYTGSYAVQKEHFGLYPLFPSVG